MATYTTLDRILDRALADGWRQLTNPPARPVPPSVVRRLKRIYQSLQLNDHDWPITYHPSMNWLERFIFEYGPDMPSFGYAGCMVVLVATVIVIWLIAVALNW